MELLAIVRVLLRRWYLVVIPVAVVAVFTVPALLNPPPPANAGFTTVIRYTAAQQLSAIPDREGDFQDVWLASELTVNAFTEWVRSRSFAEEVSINLTTRGLDIPAGAVAFNANNERSIGQIFISWGDADELVVIAAAALDVLQTRNDIYFPQVGGTPATVIPLDEPTIQAQSAQLLDIFTPLLRLGVALVAGVALAFLVEYLDPFLRRREQLASVRLRVLGTVPKE